MKNSGKYFLSVFMFFVAAHSACVKKSDKGKTADTSSLTCYSPDQNLDKAYSDGAVGCLCVAGTPATCKLSKESGQDRQVALVCENEKWIAVIDGPCGLPPPEVIPPSQ